MLKELRNIPTHFEFFKSEEIPIGRDCYLISSDNEELIQSIWIGWLNNFDEQTWVHPNNIVETIPCWIHTTNAQFISLSFMIDYKNRFHSANILLPRNLFKASFLPFTAEKKPYILVDSLWFKKLKSQSYSMYCIIDFIGIRNIIAEYGQIPSDTINEIQIICSEFSNENRNFQLILLADNILIKSKWKIAEDDKYNPEKFIRSIINMVSHIEKRTKIKSYSIFTQGANYVNEDEIDPIVNNNNLVCIPSISSPFIESFEIDSNVRESIRNKEILPKSLYIESSLYFSMKRNYYDSEEPDWLIKRNFNSKKNLREIEYLAINNDEFEILIK